MQNTLVEFEDFHDLCHKICCILDFHQLISLYCISNNPNEPLEIGNYEFKLDATNIELRNRDSKYTVEILTKLNNKHNNIKKISLNTNDFVDCSIAEIIKELTKFKRLRKLTIETDNYIGYVLDEDFSQLKKLNVTSRNNPLDVCYELVKIADIRQFSLTNGFLCEPTLRHLGIGNLTTICLNNIIVSNPDSVLAVLKTNPQLKKIKIYYNCYPKEETLKLINKLLKIIHIFKNVEHFSSNIPINCDYNYLNLKECKKLKKLYFRYSLSHPLEKLFEFLTFVPTIPDIRIVLYETCSLTWTDDEKDNNKVDYLVARSKDIYKLGRDLQHFHPNFTIFPIFSTE